MAFHPVEGIELAGGARSPGTGVVTRAFTLLGAFDDRNRLLTLSELARRADLPLATAHRMAADLVEVRALVRTGAGYAIGPQVWRLGLLAPLQTGLRETAEPFLRDLFAATTATVHLAVREGDRVLYLDRLVGRRTVPVVSRVGSRLPLHATGVGKVLLAHAPPDVRRRALRSLRRVTAHTITSPAVLGRQLDRVLVDGWAMTVEEMSLGACSVAVPVTSPDGSVVAALGLVVPSLRRDRPRLVAALQVAAHGIGRSLGGAGA